MIDIRGVVVTDEMREAGEQMASDCMDATIEKSFGGSGLGGCEALDWNNYPKNTDLVIKYVKEDICSVEAIFIAMRRAEDA